MEFNGIPRFVVFTLVYLDTFKLMLINWIKAKRTSFPVTLPFKCKILEYARPAENMTTFSYFRGYHLRKVFETDWALDIFGINHVINNLHHILPFNYLIWII